MLFSNNYQRSFETFMYLDPILQRQPKKTFLKLKKWNNNNSRNAKRLRGKGLVFNSLTFLYIFF